MNFQDLQACIRGTIGWSEHYDQSEIGPLPPALLESSSGQKFQDLHPAMDLSYISALLPKDRDLSEFLETTMNASVTTAYNAIESHRKLYSKAKDSIMSGIIFNGQARSVDQIVGENKFCGLIVDVNKQRGIKIRGLKLSFQSTAVENLTFYIFQENKNIPVHTFNVQTEYANLPTWIDLNFDFFNEDMLNLNGRYLIGYYQKDLNGNALTKNGFSFSGHGCSSCSMNITKTYKDFMLFGQMDAFEADWTNEGELPDMETADVVNSLTYGINMTWDVRCDNNEIYCQQRESFVNLYGLITVKNVLEMMKFSQELNSLEGNLVQMIIRDLEGDKDFKKQNLDAQISAAVKSTSIGYEGGNEFCIPCSNQKKTYIGLL